MYNISLLVRLLCFLLLTCFAEQSFGMRSIGTFESVRRDPISRTPSSCPLTPCLTISKAKLNIRVQGTIPSSHMPGSSTSTVRTYSMPPRGISKSFTMPIFSSLSTTSAFTKGSILSSTSLNDLISCRTPDISEVVATYSTPSFSTSSLLPYTRTLPTKKPEGVIRSILVGDVNDVSGIEAVKTYLPEIRNILGIDFAVVNADNAAGGLGLTPETAGELFLYGADVLTGGNHIFDKPSIHKVIENPKILRPENLEFFAGPLTTSSIISERVPGTGIFEITLPNGETIVVYHILGTADMKPMLYDVSRKLKPTNPFPALSRFFEEYRLVGVHGPATAKPVNAIIIDVHAQCPIQKQLM